MATVSDCGTLRKLVIAEITQEISVWFYFLQGNDIFFVAIYVAGSIENMPALSVYKRQR